MAHTVVFVLHCFCLVSIVEIATSSMINCIIFLRKQFQRYTRLNLPGFYPWILFIIISKRKNVCELDDMSKGAARAHNLKEFVDIPLEWMDLNQAMQQVSKLKDT
ncbi:hypothetical protein SLA2020_180660 [Shorea laevis]